MNSSKTAPRVEPARHWINGEWIGSSTVANSINPSTGEVLGQYSAGGRVEAAAAIAAARKAFDAGGWSHGPIHIRRPKDPHPTAPAFIEAAREMGMPILGDVNGPMRPGAGYINMNIAADGTRVSAVRAFLRPALSRPNLTPLLNTPVVKLNFKGTRCVGVKLMRDDAVRDIAADKEVILAAGTINSPKLLMLSGVGEAKALRSLGIDLVENLPGVGQNLQDHVLLSGVVFKYKGKMPDRPADSNAVEAEAYLSSGLSHDIDIGLVLHQLPVVTPEVASRFGTPPPDTFTIAPALVQPTSKGAVRLASNN